MRDEGVVPRGAPRTGGPPRGPPHKRVEQPRVPFGYGHVERALRFLRSRLSNKFRGT